MRVAILAGGAGSRLAESRAVGPKPMVEIGGHPLLWHVMSHYGHYGYNDFVIAAGYKGDDIRRYLKDYHTAMADVRIHVATGATEPLADQAGKDWVVDVVDTGLDTASGGRVKRLRPHVGDETFMLTFGDGVADVDLDAVLDLHRAEGRLCTVTAVHPQPRFGELSLDGDAVVEFSEKPMASGWVLGGYMVMEPAALDYIQGDDTPISPDPLALLAKDGQLTAYRHEGFWYGLDTLRDKATLEQLWNAGSPPWQI